MMERWNGPYLGIRLRALAAAALALLALAACGAQEDESRGDALGSSAGAPAQGEELVWVPEFYPMTYPEAAEDYYPAQEQVHGTVLYQQRTPFANPVIDTFSAETGEFLGTVTLPVEEGCTLNNYSVDGEGCIYAEEALYLEEEKRLLHYLGKYDGEGNLVWRQEITEPISSGTAINHVEDMIVDGEGRSYLRCDTRVCLFDAEGNYHGEIELYGNIYGVSMRVDGEGAVYVIMQMESPAGYYDGLILLDYDKLSAEEVFAGGTAAPGGQEDAVQGYEAGNYIFQTPGPEGKLLMQDFEALCLYDPGTGEREPLFFWEDACIRSGSVKCAGMLPDGRLMVYLQENEDGAVYGETAVFSQISKSQVPEKQQLVFASYSGYALSEVEGAIYRFNRKSSEYHIVMKTYYEYREGVDVNVLEAEAAARMLQDIASGDCPDIISLFGMNIEQLAGRGLLTDLSAYLDSPESLVHREDYYEKVLENFTFDGKLVTIPRGFKIHTLMGKEALLGEEAGWTPGEALSFWDAHPEAGLLDYVDRETAVNTFFTCMQGDYMDWQTGACRFDSPQFADFLELCRRIPESYDAGAEGTSFERYREEKSLLFSWSISSFDDLQRGEVYFGEPVTYRGYPVWDTADGQGAGTYMEAVDALAIPAGSGEKDAAWAFIQEFLSLEGGYGGVFSSNRHMMEEWAKQAMEEASGSGIGDFDVMYSFHAATEEELAQLDMLIETSRALTAQDKQVMLILSEEMPAYFAGDKTAAEVSEVIQSRVQLYMDENR